MMGMVEVAVRRSVVVAVEVEEERCGRGSMVNFGGEEVGGQKSWYLVMEYTKVLLKIC